MAQWQNWSGKLSANPRQLAFVRSEAAAQALIQNAAEQGRTVRVVGAAHSHTPLVGNDDLIIDAGALAGLAAVDRERHRARVWAGTKLYQLGPLLAQHGLALSNQGDIDRQTIAGAVSTGTHGTGTTLTNLSSPVVGARLINARGQLIECSAEQHPELYQAARLSLGALGLITQLEVALEPSYRLRESSFESTLEALLPQLGSAPDAHRHFEFFWFPQQDQAIVKQLDRTDDPAEYPLAEEGQRCAWSYEVLPNHRPQKHTEMEYSVPREQAVACLLALTKLIRCDFPAISWPVEYRHVAADDVWLSPAYERDVVTISVHQDVALDDEAYFRACEDLFLAHNGLPHWGKVHYLKGRTLAARHARWADWWAVRDEADPHGVFLNDYLRHLQPGTG